MTMTRRPPLSPLSAAATLAEWTRRHGREPRCMDCVGRDGLHWFATYYQTFALSTWSAILSTARTLTSGWSLAVVVTSSAPMKHCLNAPACRTLIPDEGPGIRLCPACHRTAQYVTAQIDPRLLHPAFSRRTTHHWGLAGDEIDEVIDAIDWGTDGGF